ncbi:MAG: formimidoylglutamase [Bacteroidales bacterium]|nr:formimidoylglutamase [Bacteroidales bacterium]
MDIISYVSPVDKDSLDIHSNDPSLLYNTIHFFTDTEPEWHKVNIAIMGMPESKKAYNNPNTHLAPDEIRKQFYQLYCWNKEVNIWDIGNIIPGASYEDTTEILSELIAGLIDEKVIPIILGGSNDLAFANYKAYEKLQHIMNFVAIDARFDLGEEEDELKSNSYLNKIILQQPNYLLNYANIGYQTYMNSPTTIALMDKLFFETYRVGMIRQDITEVEPIVRNAEMLSLDVSAIRKSDAPGNPNSSANGFYGEEICQIAMYAGLSDKLSSIGIYEYDPLLDYNGQTAQLLGHFIWYFIEGFLNRQDDLTFKDKSNYTKYTVTVSGTVEDEMIFYCSKKTGRWWVVVPVINIEKKTQQSYYLPCSYNDYKTACTDRIPDRWWRAFNKFNR